MKTARNILGLSAVAAAALTISSCTNTAYSSNSRFSDDLYSTHDLRMIAEREKAEAELAQARAEARAAQLRARIAEAEADRIQYELDNVRSSDPYADNLNDEFQGDFERRLRAFDESAYRRPSNYYDLRFSGGFRYASAYDPALYSAVVIDDVIFIEPRYVSAMLGYWNAPSLNFAIGWGTPFWNFSSSWYWANRNWNWGPWWGPSPGWGWGPSWGWGWNSGWGWGPSWGWGWNVGFFPPVWHRPHPNWWGGNNFRPGRNIVSRPSTPTWSNGYRNSASRPAGTTGIARPSAGSSTYRSGSRYGTVNEGTGRNASAGSSVNRSGSNGSNAGIGSSRNSGSTVSSSRGSGGISSSGTSGTSGSNVSSGSSRGSSGGGSSSTSGGGGGSRAGSR